MAQDKLSYHPPQAPLRLGVDLGGTKIEAVLLGQNNQQLARRRVATPQGDYEATVRAIARLATAIEQEAGAGGADTPLGLGIPGSLSPRTGLVRNANSTCLIGHDLRGDVAAASKRQVRIANDANCFALSEAVDGAAKDDALVFGVILGTGTGGGLVFERKIWAGQNAIAGEWGHNPFPADYRDETPQTDHLHECYCGRRGCIETFLSGPAIARGHFARTSQNFTAQEISIAARQGDSGCQSTLNLFYDRLARALASVINLLDPDIIVLGGGLSNINEIYDRTPELWHPYIFSDQVTTKLVKARHGDASGVRGAAWLWSADH